MTRRTLAGMFAVLAAVALTGCGSGDQDSAAQDTEAQPLNPAAVSWAEQVCQAVDSGADTLTQLPALNPAEPATTRDALVTYLGSMSEALSAVGDTITSEGTPPVTGGDKAVENAMTTISSEKSALEEAKTTLADATITDEKSFQQAISQVRSVFDELGNAEGPMKDLKANPELNKAISQATTCQELAGA